MTRRSWGRLSVVLAVLASLLLGATAIAAADPGTTVTPISADASAVAGWPQPLQELIAGTPAFQKGPWFTDPTCATRGGNPGIYINTYLAREKDFMLQLAKSPGVTGTAEAKKFIEAAGGAEKFETWPGKDVARFSMPFVGMCADTLKTLGIPDSTSVWGFRWVDTPDDTSMTEMKKITAATSSDLDPANVHLWPNNDPATNYIKAHAYFLNCDNATDAMTKSTCVNWNWEAQQLMVGADAWKTGQQTLWGKVGLFLKIGAFAVMSTPFWIMAAGGFILGTLAKAAQAVVDWVGKKGMEQVVAFIVSGVVWIWGSFMSWMVKFTISWPV